jgi:hypothetical protein
MDLDTTKGPAMEKDIVERLRDPAYDCSDEAADEIERLRAALFQLVEEKCDYMRINNLGDPETQHTVKAARAALNDH